MLNGERSLKARAKEREGLPRLILPANQQQLKSFKHLCHFFHTQSNRNHYDQENWHRGPQPGHPNWNHWQIVSAPVHEPSFPIEYHSLGFDGA